MDIDLLSKMVKELILEKDRVVLPGHGTFVNFLDLSPEIQQDIITRLDLQSTSLSC